MREVLIVSKIDVPPKNNVPIGILKAGILTIEELPVTKIGVICATKDKIVS